MTPIVHLVRRVRRLAVAASVSHMAAAVCLAVVLACTSASFARAGIISVSFQELGSDVVASFSGSVDLTDTLAPPVPQSGGPAAGMAPVAGLFVAMSATNYNYWVFLGNVVPFGSGAGATATSQSGDSFGFGAYTGPPYPLFYLPTTYASGSAFSGTMTFANQTFSSLGLTSGTYNWATIGSSPNGVTITIPESAPIPEIDPAGFGSVAALVAGALGLIERRRLKPKAA